MLSSAQAAPRQRALEAREAAARARLATERASRLPDLVLGLNVGREGPGDARQRVTTLALSGMALNHLVLPLYQPPAEGNIYRWLKWTRRALIVAIIMARP